ncbi:MAG: YdcF family protein [Rhodospirillaceae bacterium]
MSAWVITNAMAALLMPPGCLLIVMAAGALLLRRSRARGIALLTVSWVGLYALSMPVVATRLLQSLEEPYSDPISTKSGDAIVILGGGMYYRAPEYAGRDTVTAEVLARLRYGAYLHRALNKPVLVTGGSPRGERTPEAEAMKRALEDEYQVPVRWIENASTNTTENAKLSFGLVHDAGVKTIYLVTHAWHMTRARKSFELAGFTVIPAPTVFKTEGPRTVVDYLPDARALEHSSIYVHEAIGRVWYRMKSIVSSWSQRQQEGVL